MILGAGEVESLRRRRRRRRAWARSWSRSIATPLLLARGRPRKPERILICTAIGEPGKGRHPGGRLARPPPRRDRDSSARDASGSRAAAHRRGRTWSAVSRPCASSRSRAAMPSARRRIPVAGILAELRENPHDVVVIGAGGPRHAGGAARMRLLDPRRARGCRRPPDRGSRRLIPGWTAHYGYSSRYDSA